MGIIRFSDEEVFGVDSSEYEILAEATQAIVGVPGAIVEIGTRRGGSAKLIMDVLESLNDTNRPFFCIDPYGNIDYVQTNRSITKHNPEIPVEGDPDSVELTKAIKLDYDNNMRNRVIPSLYYYAYQRGFDFTFFCLEDTEFFKRYADGVPLYNEVKRVESNYALVFFDGPHNSESMVMETQFFVERTNTGSVLVFDDIWMYDHDMIEQMIFDAGFKTITKGNIKASYRKS